MLRRWSEAWACMLIGVAWLLHCALYAGPLTFYTKIWCSDWQLVVVDHSSNSRSWTPSKSGATDCFVCENHCSMRFVSIPFVNQFLEFQKLDQLHGICRSCAMKLFQRTYWPNDGNLCDRTTNNLLTERKKLVYGHWQFPNDKPRSDRTTDLRAYPAIWGG